ncbi:MAG: hypothetical protein NZ518_07580, partial [Dehalococcoidia bacterium]|nr:hypothetical protein [Dehalococcoidia bacterium]
MRFDAVVARAFSPISGQTLALAPGLTLLSGDRDVGAAWIAALAAGLTGAEPAAPWLATVAPPTADEWGVVTDLTLADGRRYRIDRDLTRRAPSRVL